MLTVHFLEVDTVAVTLEDRDTLTVVLQTGEHHGLLSSLSQKGVLPGPGEDVLQGLGVGIDGGKEDGPLHYVLRHLEVSRRIRLIAWQKVYILD